MPFQQLIVTPVLLSAEYDADELIVPSPDRTATDMIGVTPLVNDAAKVTAKLPVTDAVPATIL